MKVELRNELEDCPNCCGNIQLEVTHFPKAQFDTEKIFVVADCAHSGVCKFRKENEDERTTD